MYLYFVQKPSWCVLLRTCQDAPSSQASLSTRYIQRSGFPLLSRSLFLIMVPKFRQAGPPASRQERKKATDWYCNRVQVPDWTRPVLYFTKFACSYRPCLDFFHSGGEDKSAVTAPSISPNLNLFLNTDCVCWQWWRFFKAKMRSSSLWRCFKTFFLCTGTQYFDIVRESEGHGFVCHTYPNASTLASLLYGNINIQFRNKQKYCQLL